MLLYLVFINLIGLVTVWYDKALARSRKYRIPESRLLLIALAGGAFGVFLGMYIFKHKTENLKFSIGVPAIIIAQILIIRNFH